VLTPDTGTQAGTTMNQAKHALNDDETLAQGKKEALATRDKSRDLTLPPRDAKSNPNKQPRAFSTVDQTKLNHVKSNTAIRNPT
ncbi:hypothetical protein FE68_15315, partial [Staphylococcus aureus]|uniref:hypothetical protein n=1 Tax=Staphylococcus aureus TaxID=1280 RepID=UPI00073B33C0